MQPQRQKAGKLDESAKDYIISNGTIQDGNCILVDGTKVDS